MVSTAFAAGAWVPERGGAGSAVPRGTGSGSDCRGRPVHPAGTDRPGTSPATHRRGTAVATRHLGRALERGSARTPGARPGTGRWPGCVIHRPAPVDVPVRVPARYGSRRAPGRPAVDVPVTRAPPQAALKACPGASPAAGPAPAGTASARAGGKGKSGMSRTEPALPPARGITGPVPSASRSRVGSSAWQTSAIAMDVSCIGHFPCGGAPGSGPHHYRGVAARSRAATPLPVPPSAVRRPARNPIPDAPSAPRASTAPMAQGNAPPTAAARPIARCGARTTGARPPKAPGCAGPATAPAPGCAGAAVPGRRPDEGPGVRVRRGRSGMTDRRERGVRQERAPGGSDRHRGGRTGWTWLRRTGCPASAPCRVRRPGSRHRTGRPVGFTRTWAGRSGIAGGGSATRCAAPWRW